MDFLALQASCVAGTGIGLAATASYLWPWCWRQSRMRRIQKKLATDRILALTYDDGPSSIMTPQVLDLLRSRRARATFFMLGRNAERYPQIVDRVVKEGHDIGCHSYNHVNAWNSGPYAAIRDIQKGYDHLSGWVPPNGMFRPAHGKMTLLTYWTIRKRHAPIYWWTIDSGDTRNNLPSPRQVAELMRQDNGGIILMHDLDRDAARNRFVLDLTDLLLDVAQRESLRVVTLGELSK